jgi:uroporphyrinogen decarboxylase
MPTHRERVRTALAHERPDRPPMQISFTPEFAARLCAELGIAEGALHNPHGGGNTYALERALDEDLLLTSVGWANSYYAAGYDHPGATYTDEWGIGWRSVPYHTRFGTGYYTEMVGHPLADDEALESYMPPDPHRPELYHEAERVVREFGGEYWIVGVTVCTVFETAWALRGYARTLADFAEDPELLECLFDIPFTYHLAAANRLAELGVDMLWLGDDVGGQSGMIISPAAWRRHLKPRLARLIAETKARRPGLVVAYHSDGDITPIIPELIEIGLDVLNPIQPACMDPADLKRRYGGQLSFWGTIDEQHTLPFGTPADVRTEALRRIDTVGHDGGLILGPTHHVQLDTPMENLWALVRAITEAQRPAI